MCGLQVLSLFLGQLAVLIPDRAKLLISGLLTLIQLFLKRVDSLPICVGLCLVSTLKFSIVLNQGLDLIVLGDQ